MRIIGGEWKGRKFTPAKGNWKTRPTTDIAREALFNIVRNSINFPDISMLELFGGFGMHSIEALSRGCSSVVYVEKFKPCLNFVKEMHETLKQQDKLTLINSDVFTYLESETGQFHYIFADPPYDHPRLAELPDLIMQSGLLTNDGLFVLEHDKCQYPTRAIEKSRTLGSARD